jgi:hypothetical protein
MSDDIIKRISNIENRLTEFEKLQDLSIKNILQFDKNLKSLNEDFALIAKATSDILSFFNNMKIINIDDNVLDNDEDSNETIEDLDEFIKNNKKKYQ